MSRGTLDLSTTSDFLTVMGSVSITSQADADAPGGTSATIDFSASSTFTVLKHQGIPDASNVDLIMMVSKAEADDHIAALAANVSTSGDCYLGGIRNNPTDMTIREFVSGSLTTHLNSPHGVADVTANSWVHLKRSGTNIEVSVWPVDTSDSNLGMQNEPTPIQVSDDTLTGGGAGLFLSMTATTGRTVTVKHLAWGTGVDTAPRLGEDAGGGTGTGEDGRTPELRSVANAAGDGLVFEWKYTDEGDSAWRFLGEVVNGDPGADGLTPEMRTSGGVVQWKYTTEDDTAWRDLFTVPTGTGTGDGRTPELRVDGDFLQWKYTDETAWTNLYDLSTLKGDKGDPGPAPEMRTVDDDVQWKHADDTTWKHLFTIPAGGGGTVINVVGRAVSNKQMDIQATSDPVLGRQRLQEFFDNLATDRVMGFMDADYWAIDGTVDLHDGMQLVGRGMHRTTIDCPTASWSQPNDFIAIVLDVGSSLHKNGIYLADFGVIGADKDRTDDRPLVRLEGLEDGVIERIRVEDASSYGIYVTGYGLGDFTNDITSDFWNSTFRVAVRDCLALRGQIGFGTEGGAEGILFQHNTAIGNPEGGLGGLHGYRSASGYNVRYIGNRAIGYRNGFLIDRHRQVELNGNFMQQVRNGIALGSFYSSDPETSQATRILHNYFNCNLNDGTTPRSINDGYIGNRLVNGVTIAGNQIQNTADMSISQSRRVNIYGNTSLNGNAEINIGSSVTGTCHGNLMDVNNSSTSVRTSNNGS